MTPAEWISLEREAREAQADEIRSMALFGLCFAALSGFIVGVLVGVAI